MKHTSESNKPRLDRMQEWERKARYTQLLSEYIAVKREIEVLRRKQHDTRKELEALSMNGSNWREMNEIGVPRQFDLR